ncbi:hypothetical protein D0T25_06965 [Duganella sp. BJB488]|uniref:DUF5906 domain-containing protein n=1 Tax=unclassified Duganella TaxID=2636909 RepID=UPI000E357C6F|nr:MULTISPECIES: DUF5906 domain-containing protein [unclassified Duganella]RFP23131.1 hypothetical protein D0T26_08885 [Duganella sp. BJB489]RFP24795.1 hypothetical protein D0T25_06965 [Duganella sp. BJB488]RFP34129.1 hypothetical protein D0T24_17265 [Duganella sp. BJB480]
MTKKLSETTKAIRSKFIAHLAERYVIDESGNYPRAITASGRHQNLSSLTFDFAKWTKGHDDRRIAEDEYGHFMDGLETAIRGRLSRVCGISFKPVSTRSFVDCKGDTLLNTYLSYSPARPSNYENAKVTLNDYANRLFHQNPADKKNVLQFCAHIVKKPTEHPQWGIIMRGYPATGKSSLINLLKVAHGGRYVWSENDYTPAFSQFSEVLPNNMVVSFDDATAGKNTYEDLKLAVTRDTANVQIKGVQSILEREVYSRVFIISNSHRPFVMPADDRRFYVTEYLDHLHDIKDSEAFYEEFTAFWKNPDNAAAIYWWFRDMNLDGFTPNACVKTEARKQLIAMSTTSVDSIIAEFLGGTEISFIDVDGATQTETPPIQTVFHESQILEALKHKGIANIPPDLLRRKLTEAGYEIKRRVVGTCNNGKQIDVWQKLVAKQLRSPALTPAQVEIISAALNSETPPF